MPGDKWAQYEEKSGGKWEQYAERPNLALSPPPMPTAPYARPDNPLQQAVQQNATAGLAGVPGGSTNVVPASDTAMKVAGTGIAAGAGVTYAPILASLAASPIGKELLKKAALGGAKTVGVGALYEIAKKLTWL